MLTPDLLYLSSDRQFVLFSVTALQEEIDIAKLQQLLARSEYRNYQPNETGMQDAANACNQLTRARQKAQQAGATMACDDSQHSVLIVAKRVPGQVTITLDKEMMQAEAHIIAPYAGAPVILTDVIAALERSSVVRGHDQQAMSQLLKAAERLPPGGELTGVVARGLPPVNGDDSRFECLVELPSDRILRPHLIEGSCDQVDLRDLGEQVSVLKGAPVMRRHPPGSGIPGFKINGEVIAARPGKVLPFKPGKGAEIASADPDLLVASQEGLPSIMPQGMQVDDVMTIKQVDARHGHINFHGSVIITGNVCEGMKVKSGGSVTIGGAIESAIVEAALDVTVASGIIGHPLANHTDSCQVIAGGMIHAKFAQNATLRAETGIEIASQLLLCHVMTPGSVRVADSGGVRGTLLGGEVQAGESVTTVNLGGAADNSTRISIRGRYAELEELRQQLYAQMEMLQSQHRQLTEAGHKIAELPAGNKRTGLLVKWNASREQLMSEHAALQQEMALLREQKEQYLRNARIEVLKVLHQGVKLEVAGISVVAERDYGPSLIHYQENKLLIEPLIHEKKPHKGGDNKDPTLLPEG